MQLDKLIISTQPKSSWQAFDLGCRVAVHFYWSLLRFWLVVSVPVFVISMWLSPAYGFLIFWLFKPWYERGQLFILSRAVFGNQVSLKEALAAWPSQVKPLWFSSISYRRLAPSRSFDAPVAQLEKLSGDARSKRLSVLHQARSFHLGAKHSSQNNNTGWWTVCCAHWEVFIAVAILVMAKMLLPQEFDSLNLFNILSENQALFSIIYGVCVYLGAALVAPFYVAGGFIAYLNRRVILEAWDIELGFKRWALKYKEQAQGLCLIIIPCVLLPFMLSSPSHAQTFDKDTPVVIKTEASLATQNTEADNPVVYKPTFDHLGSKAPEKINAHLEEIYSKDPFGGKETQSGYRWKSSEENNEIQPDETTDAGWLVAFISGLAKFIEVLLWGAFVMAFAYLIYINRHSILSLFKSEKQDVHQPEMPSFVSSRFDEKMPDNLVESVRSAIDSHDFRRALSLLVRASLSNLVQDYSLPISKSMTESECLLQIKIRCDEFIYSKEKELMRAWMHMAWAHKLPSKALIESLLHDYVSIFINADNQNEHQDNMTGLIR